MKIPVGLLCLLLLAERTLSTTFNIQVTSTCTNFSGSACLAWSQSGSIIEDTAACLPGSAELVTPRGTVRMDRLRVGDSVLAYNPGTRANEYASVTHWLHRSPTARPPYLKLTTQNYELVISPYHNVAISKHQYRFGFAQDAPGLVGDGGKYEHINRLVRMRYEQN